VEDVDPPRRRVVPGVRSPHYDPRDARRALVVRSVRSPRQKSLSVSPAYGTDPFGFRRRARSFS
jgi:hypothetical protein